LVIGHLSFAKISLCTLCVSAARVFLGAAMPQ